MPEADAAEEPPAAEDAPEDELQPVSASAERAAAEAAAWRKLRREIILVCFMVKAPFVVAERMQKARSAFSAERAI